MIDEELEAQIPPPPPESDLYPVPVVTPDPDPTSASESSLSSDPSVESDTSSSIEVIQVQDLLTLLQEQDTAAEEASLDVASADQTEGEPVSEDSLLIEIPGMDDVLARLETIDARLEHPLLITPFEEYTVTEGLLLILALLVFLAACGKVLRGGFSWLLS